MQRSVAPVKVVSYAQNVTILTRNRVRHLHVCLGVALGACTHMTLRLKLENAFVKFRCGMPDTGSKCSGFDVPTP